MDDLDEFRQRLELAHALDRLRLRSKLRERKAHGNPRRKGVLRGTIGEPVPAGWDRNDRANED